MSYPNPAPAGTAASPPQENFWTKPATVLDMGKWMISLLLLLAGWGLSVETRLNRQDMMLQNINITLVQVSKSIDNFNDLKDERGQRLARIEVAIDMLRQDVRQTRASDQLGYRGGTDRSTAKENR